MSFATPIQQIAGQNNSIILLTILPLTTLLMLVHTSLRVNAQSKKFPSDSRMDPQHVSLEFWLWVFSVFGFIHGSLVEWLCYDNFEFVSCCFSLMAIDVVS